MACRMDVRESKAKRLAGITNVHDLKISRSFCGKEKATGSCEIADPLSDERRPPPWHPAIQCLPNRQNVAGLWLKYGVKSLKIETSSQCKIVVGDATIC